MHFGHFGSVAGFEPPHTFRSISKNFSFKKYLQSCRCNIALDRFGLPNLKCLQNCGIIKTREAVSPQSTQQRRLHNEKTNLLSPVMFSDRPISLVLRFMPRVG